MAEGTDDTRRANTLHRATVIDNEDPTGQFMVLIEVHRPKGERRWSRWASIVSPVAGPGRGFAFLPEVGDTVIVAFEAGDPDRPIVIGSVWNDDAQPPADVTEAADNEIKMLRTRSGVTLTIDDSGSSQSISLETPSGAKVSIDDGSASITITDATGNTILLDPSGISIESAATLRLHAAIVTIDASIATFSGIVQADSVITNSVVSSSYTPGAGNIM